MLSYIIVSELLYLWRYGIVSALVTFCVLLGIVIGLMVQDVKREKRISKRLH